MFIDHVTTNVCHGLTQDTVTPIGKRISRIVATFSLITLLIQSTGCVSSPGDMFEKPIGGYRNHVWANRAFNLRYGNCDRDYPAHFKQGFVDGYCDVCDGGDGYVPAVPPEDYWSYQYQSPEGAKCVNTWFKSYPLGVKAAREDGSGAFQKVYISKMVQSALVQEKADHVLPDDVPVVTPKQNPGGSIPVNPFSNNPAFNAAGYSQNSATTVYDPNYRK